MSTLKSFSSQYSKINEQISLSLTFPHKSTTTTTNTNKNQASSSTHSLSQFPQRHDVVNRTFLSRKLQPLLQHSKEDLDESSDVNSNYEGSSANSQWLFPDRLSDPSFGVKGHSPKKDLKRAYRRIASSSVFVTSSNADATLSDLASEQRKFSKKNYILVEESRLTQLIKLDEALQKEQGKLGKQCSIIAQDYQFPARIPIPATRYAIHHLCEEQMGRARKEIMKLQQDWMTFARQNHYHKPHLFMKNSYVDCAPYAQKAMKLRLVKEATSTWLLRKERDTMAYEDDISFLTCLYYDALQRQRDYERYYILATRYGPFPEEEFYQDSFPGKRYYKQVTIAAIKLQLLWDRYWAVTKLRRYRAARMVQKYWRRFTIYRKLHPIIRLRLKTGKKSYYRFCFALWKEYNEICRKIRGKIRFQTENSLGTCFFAWKTMIRKQIRDRQRKVDSLGTKFNKNFGMYTTFRHWQIYLKRKRQLKVRLRRLFAFPQFDMWIEYTKFSKHLKKIGKSAIRIQCLVRQWKAKKRVEERIVARTQIFRFGIMIMSHLLVKKCREKTLRREFLVWKPEELQRRQQRASEAERQRLQRKQLFIQDKEKIALKELKKHLQTANGMTQLKAMAEEHLLQQQQQLKRQPQLNDGSTSRPTSARLSFGPGTARGDKSDGLMIDQIPQLSLGTISQYPSSANLLTERGSAPLESQMSTVSSVFSDLPAVSAATAPHGILSWIPFLGTSATARQQYHKQLDLMVKKLKKSCSKMVKLLEGHNYEIKYPPFIRCYHPQCNLCFLTEEQYHRHITLAEVYPHKQEKEILLPEQKKWVETVIMEIKQQLIIHHERLARQREKEKEKQSNREESSAKEESLSKSLSYLANLQFPSSDDTTNTTLMTTPQVEEFEDHLPLLVKYGYHRTSTHFHLLIRNIKGIEFFRHYYLQQYGLTRLINSFDCYLAIQEWKKFPTSQSQYYTKAISIYETYLQEEAVRAVELNALPNYQHYTPTLQALLMKLHTLKEEDCEGFPGYYQETTKKLTSFQVIFGVQASKYLQWTTEKLFLPIAFQELEILLFLQLYNTFRMDRGFFLSNDYYQYLQQLEREGIEREDQLFEDYRQFRLNVIGNWAISFRQYELVISKKADEAVDKVILHQIEQIFRPIEKRSVRERTIEKRHEEQSHYEANELLIDEAIHWTADNCSEFIFDYYVNALLKAMWAVPEYQKGMLQYSGYAKFKLKKKNDVMANYEAMMSNKEKVQESKEWFKKFFSSTAQSERSLLPKDAAQSWKSNKKNTSESTAKFASVDEATEDHHQAMATIQKRIRGILGRKQAKKEFAKTFKKFYDETTKRHYYYHTVTQESSWNPPSLFKKLYPKAVW